MKYGMTEEGFRRRMYVEILNSMENGIKEGFGNTLDTSLDTPQGFMMQNISWDIDELEQKIEEAYLSSFIADAWGVGLDRLAGNKGIRRRGKQPSSGVITIKGKGGTVVDKGFMVGTDDEVHFKTMEDATIKGESVDVKIRSIDKGLDTNCEKESITEIITPITGVDEVINKDRTTGGRDVETDYEFKLRIAREQDKTGSATINGITSRLHEVPNVRTAFVRENKTMKTLEDGQTPKSIQCFLLGGEKKDIAQAILEAKGAGIEPWGQESDTAIDISGNIHDIGFSYAENIGIYVRVEISTNDDFDDKDIRKMQDLIIEHIGGIDADGQIHPGLGLGDDIIISQIVRKLWLVNNLTDVRVFIGTDKDNLKDENISLDGIKVPSTRAEDVVIENV